MKILINATILSEQNTGLGNYTYKILEYVCPLLLKNKFEVDILCKNKNLLPKNCQQFFREAEFTNFVTRNMKINRIAKEPYDLVWSTTQHGSLSTKNKQIITIHDLTPLIYPKGRMHQYFYYKYILPRIIKKCKCVITVSNNTKNDILKYYKNVDDKKIKVVYESIFSCKEETNKKEETGKSVLRKYKIKKQKYFCIIGIHYYYKNIHSIIETYKKYGDLKNYKVIIIGNKNNEYGHYLENIIDKYNLSDYFIFTGFVTNKEKEDIIDNCLAILYPTKYEGFGLPVLEAMDREIPVICSSSSSLPEVGGDAALYFNPDDVDDIYNNIKKITNNSKLRNELIKKGKINVAKFDWNNFAIEILNIILGVMK